MALPKTLRNFGVFNDGNSHIGEAEEVKLPKLARKMDDYRGAGMNGSVEMDLGLDKIEMEITYGGFMKDIILQYGITKVDGVMLRLAGAYEDQGTGEIFAVEVTVRGRHKEIDMGDFKGGDKGKFTVKSSLTYYKLTMNDEPLIEIDVVNGIEKVGEDDRLAEVRKAIGLA